MSAPIETPHYNNASNINLVRTVFIASPVKYFLARSSATKDEEQAVLTTALAPFRPSTKERRLADMQWAEPVLGELFGLQLWSLPCNLTYYKVRTTYTNAKSC